MATKIKIRKPGGNPANDLPEDDLPLEELDPAEAGEPLESDAAVEPEYRRRRRPVRAGKRRLGGTLARAWDITRIAFRWGALPLLLLTLAFAGFHYWTTAPVFALHGSQDIHISGNTHVTREQVLECFAPDLGRNLYHIPLRQRQQRLEEIPWVRHAAVLRIWPDQLRVRIQERQPVAFVRWGTGLELIDAQGVLLERPPQGKYDFPVLQGLDGIGTGSPSDNPAPDALRQRQIRRYLRLVQDLDQNGGHYSRDLSEIDLHDPDDVVATALPSGSPKAIVVHLGSNHFLARYRLFLAHLATWEAQDPAMTSVDLRYDGQAILHGPADDNANPTPPPSATPHPKPARRSSTKRLLRRKSQPRRVRHRAGVPPWQRRARRMLGQH